MASDQVRQASKVLGPLLRRRGTSPEVGSSLRRALQALDKSLTGISPQAQDETIEAGIAELRACIGLCEKSDRPADHEQLEGLKKALTLLAPAVVVVVAPPPELGSSTVGNGKARPAGKAEDPSAGRRRRRPTKAPALDFQTAGVLLDGYQAKLQTLHVVLTELRFRRVDLESAEAELGKQVTAIKWQGRERIPELLRVADVAKSAMDRLVAGGALVHLGESRGVEMLIGILGKAAAASEPFPEAGPTLLRTFGDAGLLEWFRKIFQQATHPAVRGLLLPLLAERNQLSCQELWELAEHAKDDIAVEAVLALPWTNGNVDLPLLLSWAGQARAPRRAHALLFAATVLGSSPALAQVRAVVRKGEGVDRFLIDALAVAGDPSDVPSLLALAEQSDDLAEYSFLAAANLGTAQLLAAMPSLGEVLSDDILGEARRMLAGERRADDGTGLKLDPSVRMLRGRPWSISGVIECLGDPDEMLLSQRWKSLELRARTGQAPSSSLPVLLSGNGLRELLASWTEHYAKANGRLKPGAWHFQGRRVEGA